jgi:hypothetical protein
LDILPKNQKATVKNRTNISMGATNRWTREHVCKMIGQRRLHEIRAAAAIYHPAILRRMKIVIRIIKKPTFARQR